MQRPDRLAPPHILPARVEHADAIARIHVAAWQAAYAGLLPADWLATLDVAERAHMWRNCINRGTPALHIALSGDAITGWICHGAARDSSHPQHAELRALYIDPDHWGRSIGQALWQHARHQLASAGYTRCHAWVLAGNVRAERFYQAAGFHPQLQRSTELAGTTVHERHWASELNH